jgi:hypothetical protein
MSRARWSTICAGALLLCASVSFNRPAVAQVESGVREATLREPWVQQLAVLESLSSTITAVSEPEARARRADALAVLQVALGEYEAQCDTVIDRIVGDPQYSYVAAEASAAMGAKLAEIHQRFEALYTDLGVQTREDVQSAQASLDELRRVMQAEVHFERDVIRVVGSVSRDQIVELATRWWNGEERAIAVKKLVARLREVLERTS